MSLNIKIGDIVRFSDKYQKNWELSHPHRAAEFKIWAARRWKVDKFDGYDIVMRLTKYDPNDEIWDRKVYTSLKYFDKQYEIEREDRNYQHPLTKVFV